MGEKRAHLKVKGRVQGVFFRAHTQETAEHFELTGWVRNTPDGAVEIIAEGEENNLNSFVEWCHKGPPSAMVSAVECQYSNSSGEFSSFRIKYY